MAKISTQNIAQAIYQATEDKHGKELDTVLAHGVEFMASRHLLSKAPDILRALEKMIDEKNHIIRASVESTGSITKRQLEEIEESIKKRYKAKEVVIEHTENKKQIGGIRITVGEEVIDLTLKNSLTQLENYLIAH